MDTKDDNMAHSHMQSTNQTHVVQHQQAQQHQQHAHQQINNQQQDMSQGDELTVFKRQQHTSRLSQELSSMLQCSALVDVTIYCDDGQVSAHKLVLAASSAYFRNLFKRMTDAYRYPVIVLRDIPVDDLKTIMEFIYTGEISVPRERVSSLMRCANYLQVEGMDSSTNALNAILASSSSSSGSATQYR